MPEDTTNPRRRRRRQQPRTYPVALFVRATEEEAAQIRANAREAKRPLSRFLAEAGARTPGAALPDVGAMHQERARDREVWEGMVYQLRKVGVNLNQLAHRENSADVGGSALPPTDAELQEAARAVAEAVQQIQERLR